MGLRIAILLAVIGGLALVGTIAYFAVPKRRGPRVAVLVTVAGVLIVAMLAIFLAPIGSVTQAPVSPNLSIYLTGQVCESAPLAVNSNSRSGAQTLLSLRATDGAIRWRAAANVSSGNGGDSFVGVPILQDSVLYTLRSGSSPGNPPATLLALRASDGGEIWRSPLDSSPLAMEITDGQVYVLLKYHEDASLLRVFNASDGAPAQQFTLPISGFTIANDLVIACDSYPLASGPSTAAIAAYHTSDGSLAWRKSVAASETNSAQIFPCVLAKGDGVVYVAPFAGNTLTAVRIADGQPMWEAQVASISSLRVSADRLIVVATPDFLVSKTNPPGLQGMEKVLALGLSDGKTLWSRDFTTGLPDGPYGRAFIALDNGDVLIATASALRALQLSDGATLWERKGGEVGKRYATPVVTQETIFVRYGYGYSYINEQQGLDVPVPDQLVALNAKTGAPYWNVQVYSTGFVLGEV
jgi:outer membrane protein assembly factor BamB